MTEHMDATMNRGASLQLQTELVSNPVRMAPQAIPKEQHGDRRSKMDTCGDILGVIGRGARKPTRIMYHANLSWKTMQKHLEELRGSGMIVLYPMGYELTNKGFQVLKEYVSIRECLTLDD